MAILAKARMARHRTDIESFSKCFANSSVAAFAEATAFVFSAVCFALIGGSFSTSFCISTNGINSF